MLICFICKPNVHCFVLGPHDRTARFEIQPSPHHAQVTVSISLLLSLQCAVSRRLDAALSALEDGCRDGERLHLIAQLEQLPLAVSPLRRLAHRHVDDEG